MAKINENYTFESRLENDIYRKFQDQFDVLLNPPFDDEKMYVEYKDEEFDRKVQAFKDSRLNEIKFLSGDAGVGKTTYLKHLFKYKTIEMQFKKKNLIIPLGWDGLTISDNNYTNDIERIIKSTICNAITKVYGIDYMDILLNECNSLIEFILSTHHDLLYPLDIQEGLKYPDAVERKQQQLSRTASANPIPFYTTLLKYVISKQKASINRIIIIIDDVETLSERKISKIVELFFHVFDCLCNMPKKVVIKLLVSLRPNSIKFLNDNLPHQTNSTYGIFTKGSDVIEKNIIPDMKNIFKRRFEYAESVTAIPGNKDTWLEAKASLMVIVDSIEDNLVKMICELCHNDIRAVTSLFKLILSNRIWCQKFNVLVPDPYLKVNPDDYRFDVVNIVRTISCGENTIYFGNQNLIFNNLFIGRMKPPSFDGSKIFIPNILADISTGKCDILIVLIMEYLRILQNITSTTTLNNFTSKKNLCNELFKLFLRTTTKEKISECLDYMFCNRLIKKSIYSRDSDDSIITLNDEDYVYLTTKGERLLMMMENDSVLLEVYREDIDRAYDDIFLSKSAYELTLENKREILFLDLIRLTDEIRSLEDSYCYTVINSDSPFCKNLFSITSRIINGIESSLNRSNLDEEAKERIRLELGRLKSDLSIRKDELYNSLK